jgi:hypothetical protein
MTVHIISVGVSLLDHLADPQPLLKDRPALAAEIRRRGPHRMLAEQDIKDGPGASDWLCEALADGSLPGICAAVRPDLWPPAASAELGTFARVAGAGRPLGRKDIAVLISSDTADGLLAGLWNAIALTGKSPDRVRYLPGPDRLPDDLRGKALLVRVPDLDAGDERGFRQAMRGLGQLGHLLLTAGGLHPDEPFRFYLSGGFKAAIPYLIGLAEGLRSITPERDVSAWVLHEATESHAIGLPLRWLMDDWVRQELKDFRADGSRSDKPAAPALLDGYAYHYDRDGKTWRLTAFGEGLRALYGMYSGNLPPEGLGR